MKKKQVVGLLGGSFNPPHKGHVQISTEFYKTLNLNELWWLVTPKNPLKDKDLYTDLNLRIKQAQEITSDIDFIKIKDIEHENKSCYSIDVIKYIIDNNPNIQFIWLIGADNMQNFHKWYKWQEIASIIPIAVINRDNQVTKKEVMNSKAALELKDQYKTVANFNDLIKSNITKAWCFVDIAPIDISSTQIRNFSSK